MEGRSIVDVDEEGGVRHEFTRAAPPGYRRPAIELGLLALAGHRWGSFAVERGVSVVPPVTFCPRVGVVGL